MGSILQGGACPALETLAFDYCADTSAVGARVLASALSDAPCA